MRNKRSTVFSHTRKSYKINPFQHADALLELATAKLQARPQTSGHQWIYEYCQMIPSQLLRIKFKWTLFRPKSHLSRATFLHVTSVHFHSGVVSHFRFHFFFLFCLPHLQQCRISNYFVTPKLSLYVCVFPGLLWRGPNASDKSMSFSCFFFFCFVLFWFLFSVLKKKLLWKFHIVCTKKKCYPTITNLEIFFYPQFFVHKIFPNVVF